MKNYYETLQVDKNASKEVISKIFKYLIKKNHPDLFQGKEKQIAENTVKALNEAYEVLSDEKKRKDYDEKLEKYLKDLQFENSEFASLYVENQNLKLELERKTNMLVNLYNMLGINDYSNVSPYNLSNKQFYSNLDNKNEFSIKNYFLNILKQLIPKLLIMFIIIITLILITKSLTNNIYL